jgi:hypothetical protein
MSKPRPTDEARIMPGMVKSSVSVAKAAMDRAAQNAAQIAEIGRKTGKDEDEAFRLWHDARLAEREDEP